MRMTVWLIGAFGGLVAVLAIAYALAPPFPSYRDLLDLKYSELQKRLGPPHKAIAPYKGQWITGRFLFYRTLDVDYGDVDIGGQKAKDSNDVVLERYMQECVRIGNPDRIGTQVLCHVDIAR